MKAVDSMIKQGYWLFRYRSYLPIVLLVFVIVAIWFNRQVYSTENIFFDLCCLTLSLFGEFIRVIAIGYVADRTSGRNTKQQVADKINHTGVYSMVRHPLYIGNFFMWFGIALFTRIWWLVLIFILIYWLYYERIIIAEENYLEEKFDQSFKSYSDIVPCVIPNFDIYKPNIYKFRIKKVLRQENSSLYGLVIVYILLEVVQDIVSIKAIKPELHWFIIGIISTLIYVTLRILKKTTRVLHNDNQKVKLTSSE